MNPLIMAAAGIALLAVGAVAAVGLGGRAWDRRTDRLVEQLGAAARDPDGTFSPAMLEALPAPVRRYFEFALSPGQRLVRSARIEHRGEFRSAHDRPWSPFESVQHFTADPPGFVWDARIRMAPGMTVRVRDSFIDGSAAMLGRIAGVMTVVDQSATPSLDAGALHRYFMECVWLPTALLPGRDVRWEAVDDSTARAVLEHAGMSLPVVVRFGAHGEIVQVEAVRMRDVDGTGMPTPFVGRFHEYRRIDGMMIPLGGEVAWLPAEGRLDYWRARITAAEYRC